MQRCPVPTDLAIREAAADEDRAIGEMLVQAYLAQHARKALAIGMTPDREAELRDQRARRAHAHILVAESGGRLAGTVALYPWGAPGSEAWIGGAANLRYLAVDPAFQGRGLSLLLLRHGERIARQWMAPAICLHVRSGADGVIRLYRGQGYVRDPEGDLDFRPSIYLEAFRLSL